MADIKSTLPVTDSADGADGSAAPANTVQVGGKDGSGNLQTLLTDTSGQLILSNFPSVLDTNFGTVGANTLRVAAAIGNATGAANFNSGATGAQTLRTASNLYDSAANGLTSTLVGAKQSLDHNVTNIQDKSGSGNIGALNATISATTNGCSSVIFNILGTWVATISLQGTIDGSNWFAIIGQVPLNITTNQFTTNETVIVPCGGLSQVRLIATAYTSGTANITWDSSAGSNVTQVINFTASALQTTARTNDGSGNSIGSNGGSLNTNTKVDLAPASPTAATVGTASAQAVAANANRKGLVLTNTSTAVISLGFGAAAVLDSGITLYPGGVFVMDEFIFDTGAVNAIASAASSNLAIQEYS